MNKIIYLTLLLILSFCKSEGQKIYDDHSISPFLSINAWKYSYATIGICYSGMSLADHYPNSYNLFLANEFKIDKNLTLGPKVGCWITYSYFATGLSLIYYLNSRNNCLALRPEVGTEIKRFKLVYGYNLKLNKIGQSNFNSHLVELTYSFRRQVFFTHRYH